MKFIGINKQITFRKENIIGVERTDETENCKIITSVGKFSCDWPYSTLMKFLETEDSADIRVPVTKNNLWGAQHFAG